MPEFENCGRRLHEVPSSPFAIVYEILVDLNWRPVPMSPTRINKIGKLGVRYSFCEMVSTELPDYSVEIVKEKMWRLGVETDKNIDHEMGELGEARLIRHGGLEKGCLAVGGLGESALSSSDGAVVFGALRVSQRPTEGHKGGIWGSAYTRSMQPE